MIQKINEIVNVGGMLNFNFLFRYLWLFSWPLENSIRTIIEWHCQLYRLQKRIKVPKTEVFLRVTIK